MDDKSFQPEWMSAPGATINDILKAKKLSVERFGELMAYSHRRVSRLLCGQEAITIEVAKHLESKIGGSAKFWMSREQQYRDDVGHLQSEGDATAASVWLSELPVRDMIKLGWLARKMHRLGRISCKVLIFRGIKFATQISAAFAEPHRP